MDTCALSHGLNVKAPIEGVGLDPRNGLDYNHPSFAYGGYRLPKDTKRLLADYQDIPQNLKAATIDANQTRKQFMVDDVLQQGADTVGISRLATKQGSGDFRDSAVLEVAHQTKPAGTEVLVYEANAGAKRFQGLEVVK